MIKQRSSSVSCSLRKSFDEYFPENTLSYHAIPGTPSHQEGTQNLSVNRNLKMSQEGFWAFPPHSGNPHPQLLKQWRKSYHLHYLCGTVLKPRLRSAEFSCNLKAHLTTSRRRKETSRRYSWYCHFLSCALQACPSPNTTTGGPTSNMKVLSTFSPGNPSYLPIVMPHPPLTARTGLAWCPTPLP